MLPMHDFTTTCGNKRQNNEFSNYHFGRMSFGEFGIWLPVMAFSKWQNYYKVFPELERTRDLFVFILKHSTTKPLTLITI
jgi:hypothetical protein